MPWYSYAAIFFVLWWLVLFAVLPFGISGQNQDEIILGTERGAPSRVGFARKALITTAVTAVIFAGYYFLTAILGYSFDDIPSFVPAYQ